MAKLVICVGLARSGKSSYANDWMNEDIMFRGPHDLSRVVINADEFRLAMHGRRFAKEAEPLVHTIIDIVLRVLMQGPYHILIDECNTTEKLIKKWLMLDPKAEFVYLDTSPGECKGRAINTDQPDLVEKGVIDRMAENLQITCFGEITGQHPTQEEFATAIERIRNE